MWVKPARFLIGDAIFLCKDLHAHDTFDVGRRRVRPCWVPIPGAGPRRLSGPARHRWSAGRRWSRTESEAFVRARSTCREQVIHERLARETAR